MGCMKRSMINKSSPPQQAERIWKWCQLYFNTLSNYSYSFLRFSSIWSVFHICSPQFYSLFKCFTYPCTVSLPLSRASLMASASDSVPPLYTGGVPSPRFGSKSLNPPLPPVGASEYCSLLVLPPEFPWLLCATEPWLLEGLLELLLVAGLVVLRYLLLM